MLYFPKQFKLAYTDTGKERCMTLPRLQQLVPTHTLPTALLQHKQPQQGLAAPCTSLCLLKQQNKPTNHHNPTKISPNPAHQASFLARLVSRHTSLYVGTQTCQEEDRNKQLGGLPWAAVPAESTLVCQSLQTAFTASEEPHALQDRDQEVASISPVAAEQPGTLPSQLHT